MEQYTLIDWLPYVLLGFVGILYHIWSKPEGGSMWQQLKNRNTIMAILAYGVLVFMWQDGTLEVISVSAVPSALSFVLGYFSQSILSHVIKQVGSRLQGNKEG